MPCKEKFDLNDCSIVIPVHIDSKERLEHVEFQLTYFERHFAHHQLIIVELGMEQKIFHPSARFVKGEKFSLAEISNMGAELVDRPFFCKYDVDALIHPKALFDAFETLKQDSQIAMLMPYNGISFTIENPLRKTLMESFSFDGLPFVEKGQHTTWRQEGMYVKNDNSLGLIHHFNTSFFKDFGGYNEEFIGWGYEDNEIVNRFEKLKQPARYLQNYNAFHLDHPRMPGDPVQAAKNQFKSIVIKTMDEDDLRAYISSWNRFT